MILPKQQIHELKGAKIGFTWKYPRAIAGIISSNFNVQGPVGGPNQPRYYVIGKLINPGMSDAPLILEKSGAVVAVCVAQQHSKSNPTGLPLPTNFGITSALLNKEKEIKEIIGQ